MGFPYAGVSHWQSMEFSARSPNWAPQLGVSTDGAGGGESATKAAGAGGVWRVGALIERVGMLL